MDIPLSETLRRLDAQIDERGLDRTAVLNAKDLADKTSLPVKTVRALLQGKAVRPEPFDDRVLARIQNFVALHLAQTRKSETELIGEVMTALSLSRPWARSVIRGEKVPNAKKLHELAVHFKLDGQETYFTSDAETALNRELKRILLRYESPERDPIEALMEQYGVRATDMRVHGHMTGITSKEQLAALLEGVFKSVLPPKGGQDR
ncbi:hypothetical protein [Streptomyces sp. VN1]|uniref:hypothetical protein n=1 Tax=Streptomyces sp. VN1 TaxID=1821625 RepID=UPI001413E5E8|nr:hypothetical protein [Streptomyces sp. VN1]QIP74627.1 hypothetical protein EZV63_36255 [Streptomyces sp. VN1]